MFYQAYLDGQRPTLNNSRGNSLTHPMLIIVFVLAEPRGHAGTYWLFDRFSFLNGAFFSNSAKTLKPCESLRTVEE